MVDSENAVEETTTTTTLPLNIHNTHKRISLRYDSRYIRKKGGIAKIVEILLSFLGFICIQCTYYSLHSTGKWFTTVSVGGVWISGVLLFCYLFHFVEKFVKIPWIKFELFYCLVISVCYLVASLMAITIESDAFQAASFFGFLAAIIYACDAYAKYLLLKSGDPAQGDKEIDKEIVVDVSPTSTKVPKTTKT